MVIGAMSLLQFLINAVATAHTIYVQHNVYEYEYYTHRGLGLAI